MAWIKMVDETDAEGDLQLVYATLRASRGRVANILKVHSLAPRTLNAHLSLYSTIMFGLSELSRVEREMIAVAVSVANACHY